MKIPAKIKIGGHWFRIEYRDEDNNGYDKSGTKHSWLNKIFLQKGMVRSKQESTLFHEIVHELDWQHEIGLNEKQISTLAEGFYQVLVDNKWLKE